MRKPMRPTDLRDLRRAQGTRSVPPAALLVAVSCAVAGLLLLPQTLAGAPSLVMTPPYTSGYPASNSTLQTSGCGTNSSFGVRPHFSLISGRARSLGHVSTVNCGNPIANNSAYAGGAAGISGLAFVVSSSGHHRVVLRWSVSWVANLSLSVGNTSKNHASAAYLFELFSSIQDGLTGRRYHPSSPPVENTSRISNPLCCLLVSLTRNASWSAMNATVVFHLNLTAGRIYYLDAMAYVQLYADVSSGAGYAETARATFDMASPGLGARLLSVSIR